jgi:hypothetical protein
MAGAPPYRRSPTPPAAGLPGSNLVQQLLQLALTMLVPHGLRHGKPERHSPGVPRLLAAEGFPSWDGRVRLHLQSGDVRQSVIARAGCVGAYSLSVQTGASRAATICAVWMPGRAAGWTRTAVSVSSM